MRLVFKLTTVFTLVVCLVLLLYGYQASRREVALFDRNMAAESRILAHAFSTMLRDVLRNDGPAEARLILKDMSELSDRIRLRWYKFQEPAGRELLGRLDPTARASLESGRRVPLILRSASVHRTLVSIPDVGEGSFLVLEQSLGARDEYVRGTIRILGLFMLLLLVTLMILTFLLGTVFVGRPVERIVARMRLVGAGDLSGRLPERGSDELGEIGTEINKMCEQLGRSQLAFATETRIRERTEDKLWHAERLASVGRLAAGIAHEIGTPLNVIAGRARILQRGTLDVEHVTGNAAIIYAQTQRIIRIIDQLLSFARRSPVRMSSHSLSGWLCSMAETLRTVANEKGVYLEVQAVAEDLRFIGDCEQLQQVITNAIVNAVQASEPGQTVVIGGDGEIDDVRIFVQDRGCGIPAEVLTKVFEPFFTTKDIGEGTGLGLAVAHGIVKEHGGRIEIESREGEGTRLVLFLRRPRPDET